MNSSEIVKDILDIKAIAFGVPTIYDEAFPSAGDIIYYLRGLKFNRTDLKRKAVTFGSMGGKGGAPNIIKKELEECGFDVLDEIEIYYLPKSNDLEHCFEMGRKLVD
jgi:coenzyme F420H2 oxidase